MPFTSNETRVLPGGDGGFWARSETSSIEFLVEREELKHVTCLNQLSRNLAKRYEAAETKETTRRSGDRYRSGDRGIRN